MGWGLRVFGFGVLEVLGFGGLKVISKPSPYVSCKARRDMAIASVNLVNIIGIACYSIDLKGTLIPKPR